MLFNKDQEQKIFSDESEIPASRIYGFGINLEEMAQAGVHFGHRASNCHPKMKPYFQTVRNGVAIINLEKSAEKLEEALKFIEKIISESKTLLLVGTKIQVKDLVKTIAVDCGLPYVENRWLGGTFTNFDVMRKRVAYLKDLEAKKESGELAKYTKKEQAKINKKILDLEAKFGGIKELEQLPEAVFVVDMKKDASTVKEAQTKKVKIISICDANVNPSLADYPIPANDDAVSSVKYILEKLKEVITKTKNKSV